MRHVRRSAVPQPHRQLLRSTHDAAVVVVGGRDDHTKDFEDRVGVVGIPTTRTESDLPEHFPHMEGLEVLRRGEESVERLVVVAHHEVVPDPLDLCGVAVTNGLRSEEHTTELQSLMRISSAVLCLKPYKPDN